MNTEDEIDLLYMSPERFRLSPQVGVPRRVRWSAFASFLSKPAIGTAKDIAGAWSPAVYTGNVRRKAALVSVGALVVDVDERGDVDAAARLVGRYTAVIHETFTSSVDAPRCRIVLLLAEPVDASTYEQLHKVVRRRLATAGLVADEGAKDASRLSYSPVRRSGASYRFRSIDGEPLDARAVLAAQPKAPVRAPVLPPAPQHRDRYVRAALRRAADEVTNAGEGVRHYTLSREAFSLARLGLAVGDIEPALLPAFVAAAGERREYEGRRTIRDAVRARRGAGAA